MADLGNISGLLREASLSDLSWLDINEEEYRKQDSLPEQNLDMAPDLQALWSHGTSSASSFVPNKEAPKTMSDLAKSKVASETIDQVAKTARFALMQSTDLRAFQAALTSRFDKQTLQASRSVLAAVLGERGLLGKWYILAEDFHPCGRYSKKAADFVRRYASEARYLLAKEGCPECVRLAGTTCSVFQKKIVLEVPYTEALADKVEQLKAASGRVVASTAGAPRERIKAALLSEQMVLASTDRLKPIENTVRNLGEVTAQKRIHLRVLATKEAELIQAQQTWQPPSPAGKTASARSDLDKLAFDVTATIRRELLKGRSEREVIQACRLSFTTEALQATRAKWEPLFKEAGLFGTIYSTQDSFDDCNAGADFLVKHASTVKGIVAGEKCDGCNYNKLARCLLYGRPLVASQEELYTPETVKQVLREQRTAGKLQVGSEKVSWGGSPQESLKAIYRVASAPPVQASSSRQVETAFTGNSYRHVTAGLTTRDIVKTARRFQNEGLYGKDLVSALKRRFDPRDIIASKEDLRPVLAEQGLQGIYYVDPTVYDDYGHGCHEASRLHGTRLVAYVKVGSACASCVHQHGNKCSKIGGKPIVEEPPYEDKKAQQQEMLASGNATQVRYEDLVNNGRSMLAEFNMQNSMDIELDPVRDAGPSMSIDLGFGKVKL